MLSRLLYKYKEFVLGLSANGFSQIVNIVMQLGSLPIFLSYWDLHEYGEWLILSAIPAYFSLLNGGFVAVTMNNMTIHCSLGEYRKANEVFQTALFTISAIICVVLMLVGVVFLIFNVIDNQLALFLLIASTMLNLYSGIIDGTFRSTGKYAQGTVLLTIIRLGEWSGSIIFFLFSHDIFWTAFGWFLGRLVGFTLLSMYVSLTNGIYTWGFSQRNFVGISDTAKKSLSYFIYVLSNAFNLQGMVLLVGGVFGPQVLAIYSVYRRIVRLNNQVIGMVGQTLWPMFTKKYNSKKGNNSDIGVLVLANVILALGMALIIYFITPAFLEYWGRGKIDFDGSLLILMLVWSVVSGSYGVLSTYFISTNSLGKLPVFILGAYVIQLVLVYFISVSQELSEVVVVSIIVELVIFSGFFYRYLKLYKLKVVALSNV